LAELVVVMDVDVGVADAVGVVDEVDAADVAVDVADVAGEGDAAQGGGGICA